MKKLLKVVLCAALALGLSVTAFADEIDDIKQGAEQGIGWCQTWLADLYLRGERGLPKDINKAIYWYKRAAAAEGSSSYGALALIYGFKAPPELRSKGKQLYWSRKAAANDDNWKDTVKELEAEGVVAIPDDDIGPDSTGGGATVATKPPTAPPPVVAAAQQAPTDAEQGKKDKAHELYIDGAALVMESNKEDNEEKQKRGQDLLKRAADMGHEAAARLLGIAQERNPTLSVSTDTLYFDAKGGTKTIAVTSNTGWGFKKYATSEETIIRHDQGKINFEGIKTGRGIEIDVKPNAGTESQQCRFYLIAASKYKGYGTKTIEVTVNQEGRTVHKCHACKGKGKIDQTCVACGGRIFITIQTMYGPQTRPCNFCQGKADNGMTSGKIPTPCFRCNQTGKCQAPNCFEED